MKKRNLIATNCPPGVDCDANSAGHSEKTGSAKFSLVTYNATLLSYFGFLCLGKGFIGFKNFMCENTGKIFERAKVFMILERPSEEANCNMISEISGLYEAARLEKIWERYGREMSLLKGLEPTDNFTIQVQHYHDVVAEAQIVAIENLKHIDSKCTNYWSLFNAFYFSATVTTTLGYGNVFPLTDEGRLFCIFYAMIGVPLYYFLMHMTTNYIIEIFINLYKTISVSSWMNSIQVSFTLYIFLGIIVFSAVPGFIVSHIEGWDFITTAYFTVITLFSIGFGDVVPSNDYESFTKDPPKKWSNDWKTFETPERINYSAPVFYSYRVFVYIWTVIGLAWSGGVLSILVNIQKLKTMNDELKAQTRKVSTDQVYINSSLNSECKIAFQSRIHPPTNLSTF